MEDGVFHYLGRNDFQVKISGVRIECEEAPHAVSALLAVLDSGACSGIPKVRHIVPSAHARSFNIPPSFCGHVLLFGEGFKCALKRAEPRTSCQVSAVLKTHPVVGDALVTAFDGPFGKAGRSGCRRRCSILNFNPACSSLGNVEMRQGFAWLARNCKAMLQLRTA